MKPPPTGVAVVPLRSHHASAFRDLNIAWVKRYFGKPEEKDNCLLDDPEGRIIGRGGAVLIAENKGGRAVGCVALVPIGDGVLELAKMAVDDRWQGQGVGRLLMDAAIALAKEWEATALYLESNSSLGPAIRLYERTGFRHLRPDERRQSPYARCDVYMRLDL